MYTVLPFLVKPQFPTGRRFEVNTNNNKIINNKNKK